MSLPDLTWNFNRHGWRRGSLELAAFAGLLMLLSWCGYRLCDRYELLASMWPESGLLVVAIWKAPPRSWGWLLAVEWAVEILTYLLEGHSSTWKWAPVLTSANAIAAIGSAMAAKHLLRNGSLPVIHQVLLLMAAVAIGAAAGALPGAWAFVNIAANGSFDSHFQIWWGGYCLGSLVVVPVIFLWTAWYQSPERSPAVAREVCVIGAALLGLTFWTFSSPPAALTSIFHSPVWVLGLVIMASFRLPPRWAATLVGLVVMIACLYTGRRFGPFAIEPDAFSRIGTVQLDCAAACIINLIIGTTLHENRRAVLLLSRSEELYRNFVEKTSEAVWQIEFTQPMALDLPMAAQATWLRTQGRLAQCNLSFRELNTHAGTETAWSSAYIDNLERAAANGYCIDGLQFSVGAGEDRRIYRSGFTAVLDQGSLVRLWGVAREITDLVDLNERLSRDQARMQQYARQLIGAEESARRATAVDLHDGIGQQLAGLAMSLDAAALGNAAETRTVLVEAGAMLRDIHAITRRVIADLSPPGLYDLGLEPALQWLCRSLSSRDNFETALECSGTEHLLSIDTRILAFKVIRELLRNIVKHAGVPTARLMVMATPQQLFIDVIDEGAGFTWNADPGPAPHGAVHVRGDGFGLWSIVERVHTAMGDIMVDTAPGMGCSVSITLPLEPSARHQ